MELYVMVCPLCGRPLDHYGPAAGVGEHDPVECGGCAWVGAPDQVDCIGPVTACDGLGDWID